MSIAELLLIAVSLSMDAFAVAISCGLTISRVTLAKAAVVGLYFGGFQAIMPVLGYALATSFANSITKYDHWLAFILLTVIGGKMVVESLAKNPREQKPPQQGSEISFGPGHMLPLAVATSIDAMAVGVSLAVLKVEIVFAAALIGITTLALSMAGVKIGHVFGLRFKAKAEFLGGLVLMLMGLKILLTHLGIVNL